MNTKIFYNIETTSQALDCDIINIGLVAVTEKKELIEDAKTAIKIIEKITGQSFTEEFKEDFDSSIVFFYIFYCTNLHFNANVSIFEIKNKL